MKFQFFLSSIFILSLVEANQADVATVLFSDVESNLNDYISYARNNPSFSFPTVLISYFKEITTFTDDSYTSLLSDFPVAQITSIAEELPWYSSRLESKLDYAVTAHQSSSISSYSSTTSGSSMAAITSLSSGSSISSKSSDSSISSSVSKPSATSTTSSSSSSSSAFADPIITVPSITIILGLFSSFFFL